MKILSCCPPGYYAKTTGVSYEYLSFVEIPRLMGHTVHNFDFHLACKYGKDHMNDFFLSIVKNGGYDLVFIQTYKDEFIPEVLDEAKKYSITMAWNTDDDWRWDRYSCKWVEHYTFMVTTYRHIYEENKGKHPNLLLSQWGCTGFDDGFSVPKDIDISFVGACYGTRIKPVTRLCKEFGMAAYGKNVGSPRTWINIWKERFARRILGLEIITKDLELDTQSDVKNIWNRSKISFSPLESSKGDVIQIKARVFDLGLSGSVMLCTKNPAMYEFYEPGKEFVEYETMDECVDKAKYLLKNESERSGIAKRYYERTKKEHLWTHRFTDLFKKVELSNK